MFGLGFSEILLICVIALLLFGPEKLPEIAKTLGRTAAQFRRAMDELKFEINMPLDDSNSRIKPQSQANRPAEVVIPSALPIEKERVDPKAASPIGAAPSETPPSDTPPLNPTAGSPDSPTPEIH